MSCSVHHAFNKLEIKLTSLAKSFIIIHCRFDLTQISASATFQIDKSHGASNLQLCKSCVIQNSEFPTWKYDFAQLFMCFEIYSNLYDSTGWARHFFSLPWTNCILECITSSTKIICDTALLAKKGSIIKLCIWKRLCLLWQAFWYCKYYLSPCFVHSLTMCLLFILHSD